MTVNILRPPIQMRKNALRKFFNGKKLKKPQEEECRSGRSVGWADMQSMSWVRNQITDIEQIDIASSFHLNLPAALHTN